jgi:hypothetical protein
LGARAREQRPGHPRADKLDVVQSRVAQIC